MRTIVLGACVALAACSGQNFESPTAPTGVRPSPAAGMTGGQTQAHVGASAPFKGSFDIFTRAEFPCTQPCQPATFRIIGRFDGTATQLGRFTAESVDIVDTATNTASGTMHFTAANGDQLFATTQGIEDRFTPPNVSEVTIAATIVGGTGRFAEASGTFTIRHRTEIDFVNQISNGTGELEGQMTLAH